MSYESEKRKGYLISEKKQQKYIVAAMAAYRHSKAVITDLVKTFYASLAGTDPERYWSESIKFNRYDKLSKKITVAYKGDVKQALTQTGRGLSDIIQENYNRQQYIANWVAPLKPRPINQNLVAYSVTGNVDVWKKIQSETFEKIWGNPNLYSPQAGTLRELFSQNAAKDLDDILRRISNGLKNGQSFEIVARDIRKIIGSYARQKGLEEASGAMYKALRIARTEGQRVLNAASLANSYQAQAQGLDIKKLWISTLDDRTRESHIALDQQEREIDKPFRSPVTGATGQAPGQMSQIGDNINCRCSYIEIIDDVKPETRSARNPVTGKTELISYKGYNKWVNDNNL